MKFLKISSSIFAGLLMLFLIFGNIFHKKLRNIVNKNYVPVLVEDSDFDEILSQTHPEYYFGVYTEEAEYYPYERILVYAKILNKDDYNVPENAVVKVSFAHDDQVIKNIEGDSKLKLVYDSEKQLWWGYWYPEDTTMEGNIEIKGVGFPDTPETPLEAYNHFNITRQTEIYELEKGLCLIGIDSQERISLRSLLSPEGEEEDWDYISSWVEFSSADGILMLGGITKTFEESVSLNSPWDKDKISETQILAERINDIGEEFGVWIKCLELEGTYLEKMGYEPSLYLNGDNYSRADSSISLLDENRKNSIKELYTTYLNDNNVSYIGFSHLFHEKNYDLELLNDFITEFMVAVPEGWEDMEFDEKFDNFVVKLNNESFMENFELWKNYQIADYIREIISSTEHSKPVFYYCDVEEIENNPEIFNILFGAGIDFIVVNLKMDYSEISSKLEALKELSGFENYYDRMIISYEINYDYVDMEDFDLSAMEIFVNANLQIVHYGSKYDNVQGIMINDLYEAMFGKRGPYSPYEWMLSVSKTIYKYKWMHQEYPLEASMFLNPTNTGEGFKVLFRMANMSMETLENVQIRFLPIQDAKDSEQITHSIEMFESGSEEYIELPLELKVEGSQFVRKKYFIGIRVSWDETENTMFKDNSFIDFLSIDVDNIPKIETETEELETEINENAVEVE